jgi:hypothetical protein
MILTAIGAPPGGGGPYICSQIEKKQPYTQGKKYAIHYQKKSTQKRKQNMENNKANKTNNENMK